MDDAILAITTQKRILGWEAGVRMANLPTHIFFHQFSTHRRTQIDQPPAAATPHPPPFFPTLKSKKSGAIRDINMCCTAKSFTMKMWRMKKIENDVKGKLQKTKTYFEILLSRHPDLCTNL